MGFEPTTLFGLHLDMLQCDIVMLLVSFHM